MAADYEAWLYSEALDAALQYDLTVDAERQGDHLLVVFWYRGFTVDVILRCVETVHGAERQKAHAKNELWLVARKAAQVVARGRGVG